MYPQWYKQMLCNALVEVHFTLTHYSIVDKNSRKNHSDVYIPKLYSMRVLKIALPAVDFLLANTKSRLKIPWNWTAQQRKRKCLKCW
jgi:hypothetical protein